MRFCDEFDTLDLWNGTSGTWNTSYYWQGTPNGSTLPNEQEWYIDARYGPTSAVKPWSVANGVLSITASRTDPSVAAYTAGHHFVSGQLNTGLSFSQLYGYFELRAKLPRGQGLWPAFWLVPKDGTASHEIDIMEVLGQDTRTLHTTLHVFKPSHVVLAGTTEIEDTSLAFHLFGVDWQRDKIVWYFDRRPVFEAHTPTDLRKPMFMILNLAAGGPMAGRLDASTPLPATMQVDYVRVYSSLPRDSGPDPTSLPLGHCTAAGGGARSGAADTAVEPLAAGVTSGAGSDS